ncbi:phosphatases II [Trichocladium antarcticum]|uniref:phosphatidylinositol-3,4,5-trisphosphate 3-phosphatase n=1 Tax=Trichocladium antarcticum TaxID=1450529 RepID=A0AAN6UCY0_9PEZI|nr:phosphatases II [Trichocladium antarcticum]
MTSILRQLVAGPRAKHSETGLDLCYVTSNIIATSGPSQTYPQRAYRNPLDRLVAFLDAQHGDGWAIWEFRAEGTGYPDEAVRGRIRHYPWPDHHPPPFGIVPGAVGGMRNWLRGGLLDGGGMNAVGGGDGDRERGGGGGEKKQGDRVVVVHCKAGKGRSGTMACAYLIAECGWTPEDALARFTARRMRPGFGTGVSIPSQLRWVGYVDRWTRGGKKYVERAVEIVEVHVWGLRNGVKVAVEGFVESGQKIRVFHTFKREERIVVEGGAPGGDGVVDLVQDMAGYGVRGRADETGEGVEDAGHEENTQAGEGNGAEQGLPSRGASKKLRGSRTVGLVKEMANRKLGSSHSPGKMANDGKIPTSKTTAVPEPSQASSAASLPGKDESRSQSTTSLQSGFSLADPAEPGGQAVIFKPASPICIPNNDVNISVERRNRATMGLTMVTAVAHVWFNTFFEGNGAEQDGKADQSGVFEIEWDKMDGIKGSGQRGTRALDRLAVVWRVAGTYTETTGQKGGVSPGVAINEPGENSPVPQMQPADWKGPNAEDPAADKHLGLRLEAPDSQNVSKTSSVAKDGPVDDAVSLEGVRVSGPAGEEVLDEAPIGDAVWSSSAEGLDKPASVAAIRRRPLHEDGTGK